MELCSDADFKASLGWENRWKHAGSQNALDVSEHDNEMPEVTDGDKEDEFESDCEDDNNDLKLQSYEVFTNKWLTDQQWYTCIYRLCCRQFVFVENRLAYSRINIEF